jgi:ADP-ribose pyrophosphatase YjhB (NUDIX family)
MGGRWDSSAGGHIHWDEKTNRPESPEKTARREVNEELFHKKRLPAKLKLKKVGSFWKRTRPNDYEWVHLFSAIYKGPFFINREEVSKVRFIPVKELLRETETYTGKFTRSVGVCIRQYLRMRKNGKEKATW